MADDTVRVPLDIAVDRTRRALEEAGADEASAEGATRAMRHASLHGVDSHGFRLVTYYTKAISLGGIKGAPRPKITRTAPGTAVLDADDGLGHPANYAAMALACEMAMEVGIGAVTIIRSSHYGAAGAYALAAAEHGYIGMSVSNTDSSVLPHGATKPYHGTNPIAFGAPVAGERPWLLDMATSSIPLNRAFLYRTLGRNLPEGVAADEHGEPTIDPALVKMLIPVGGVDFGFKGAALGGVVTILSAALAGTSLDHEMGKMTEGPGLYRARNLGQFALALDPERFAGRAAYESGMKRYLAALRSTPPKSGETVMAAGDREWKVADERTKNGIPLDHETVAFLKL